MLNFNPVFISSPVSKKLKQKFLNCHLIQLINSFLEILSISLVIPIISFILDQKTDFLSKYKLNFLINFFENSEQKTIILVLVFSVISFFLIRVIIQISISAYELKFIYQVKKSLQREVFKRCIFIDLKNLENTPINEQHRNISDIGTVTKYITSLLLFNSNIILAFLIIVFLLNYDLEVTVFFIFLFSLSAFAFISITKKFYSNAGIELRRIAARELDHVFNSLNSLKEIIIDKKRAFFFDLFKENHEKGLIIDYKSQLYAKLPRIIGEFIFVIAIFSALFYFLNIKDLEREIMVDVSLFTIAGLRLLPLFVYLSNSTQNLRQSLYPTQRIFEILKKPFKEEFDKISKNDIKEIKSIKLKNVKFGYKKSGHILKNINFTITKNKIVGIMGESGSGKSTLVNLITGLLKPNSGSISYNNKNIYQNLNEWHNSIGYVPQDVFLIRGKLKNNIAFGINNNFINKKKIKSIIKICELQNFIKNKKNNLDLLISEKSTNISGGQKQRIGIARALYKNPKILILDETLSNLDEKTEGKILKNIKSKYKKLIIIIISHRISTLKKFANIIFKVEKGKVAKVFL